MCAWSLTALLCSVVAVCMKVCVVVMFERGKAGLDKGGVMMVLLCWLFRLVTHVNCADCYRRCSSVLVEMVGRGFRSDIISRCPGM